MVRKPFAFGLLRGTHWQFVILFVCFFVEKVAGFLGKNIGCKQKYTKECGHKKCLDDKADNPAPQFARTRVIAENAPT